MPVYTFLFGRHTVCACASMCVTSPVQQAIVLVSGEWWCVCAAGRVPIHGPDIFTTRSVWRLSRDEPQPKHWLNVREREGERPTLRAVTEPDPISEPRLNLHRSHNSHSSPLCFITVWHSVRVSILTTGGSSPIFQHYIFVVKVQQFEKCWKGTGTTISLGYINYIIVVVDSLLQVKPHCCYTLCNPKILNIQSRPLRLSLKCFKCHFVYRCGEVDNIGLCTTLSCRCGISIPLISSASHLHRF